MEDILASIRRILSEDEAPAGAGERPAQDQPQGEGADNGVLVLDPAMMVSDPAREAEPLPSEPSLTPAPPEPSPAPSPPETLSSTLVAPEAAAAIWRN